MDARPAAVLTEPVVMRPRWCALPVTAVGCLVFVALGAAFVASGEPAAVAIGMVAIVFFGGGLVGLVLRRSWRWSIVIDDRGVTWRRPGGDTLVRRENIGAVYVTKTGRLGGSSPVPPPLIHPPAPHP